MTEADVHDLVTWLRDLLNNEYKTAYPHRLWCAHIVEDGGQRRPGWVGCNCDASTQWAYHTYATLNVLDMYDTNPSPEMARVVKHLGHPYAFRSGYRREWSP